MGGLPPTIRRPRRLLGLAPRIAGYLPSAKRMRLADFANPARVGDAALQGGFGDFGKHTVA